MPINISQVAKRLIRQLNGLTLAQAKDALDYTNHMLDETQIVSADAISQAKGLSRLPSKTARTRNAPLLS